MTNPLQQRIAILSEQTPPDWDRGGEFEWLALGGTKIYNIQESTDGQTCPPQSPPIPMQTSGGKLCRRVVYGR